MYDTMRPARVARRDRVIEAAKVLVYHGAHGEDGQMWAALEALEAAVKDMEPIDLFVNLPLDADTAEGVAT